MQAHAGAIKGEAEKDGEISGTKKKSDPKVDTLQKSNIDTRIGVLMELPFPNHDFGYPAVSFRLCISVSAQQIRSSRVFFSSAVFWLQHSPQDFAFDADVVSILEKLGERSGSYPRESSRKKDLMILFQDHPPTEWF